MGGVGAGAAEVAEGAVAPLERAFEAVAGDALAPLAGFGAVLAHRLDVRARDHRCLVALDFVGAVDGALGVHQEVVVDVAHPRCELLGELAEVVGGQAVVGPAPAVHVGARVGVAEVGELAGLGLGEMPGRPHRVHGAHGADGRVADLAVFGDDPQIAGGGEFGSAGEAVAVDLGDHGLGQLPDDEVAHHGVAGPVVVLGVGGAGVGQAGPLVDVGAVRGGGLEVVAGGEGAPRALDHDDADFSVGLGALERVEHLAAQLVGERVELLGAVEGDGGDAVVGLVEDEVVAHGGSSVVRGEESAVVCNGSIERAAVTLARSPERGRVAGRRRGGFDAGWTYRRV